MSNHSVAHSALVNEILIAVTALPGATMWRHPTGQAVTRTGAVIRFGFPGSGDIVGVYRGRAVAIDAKTGTGRLSDDQKTFRANWERSGGLYIVARCVDDALSGLASIRAIAA